MTVCPTSAVTNSLSYFTTVTASIKLPPLIARISHDPNLLQALLLFFSISSTVIAFYPYYYSQRPCCTTSASTPNLNNFIPIHFCNNFFTSIITRFTLITAPQSLSLRQETQTLVEVLHLL